MQRLSAILILSLMSLFTTACQLDINVTDLNPWDPPRTEVLSKNKVYANGQDRGILKLKVFSKEGTVLQDTSLTSASLPNGLKFDGCTPSNSEGITYCTFRSMTAGTFSVNLFDGTLSFSTDITFIDMPSKFRVTRVASSKRLKTTQSGYSISSGIVGVTGSAQQPAGYEIKTEAPPVTLDFRED